MAFKETFIDLRARRRIPMRLFKERAGVHPSYIHGIEHEGVVPSPEKLEQLVAVFVGVAEEQGAADPEADARSLYRERDREELVDRIGLDPELADAVLLVREMSAEARSELIPPLYDGVAVYGTIDPQERRAATGLVAEIRALVESQNRHGLVTELAAVIERFLADAKASESVSPHSEVVRPS
jgi:transcriptional regulator with XRE-family HTH domain